MLLALFAVVGYNWLSGRYIEAAKEKGVTEIILDATESGKPLYKKCGFVESVERMVLNLE